MDILNKIRFYQIGFDNSFDKYLFLIAINLKDCKKYHGGFPFSIPTKDIDLLKEGKLYNTHKYREATNFLPQLVEHFMVHLDDMNAFLNNMDMIKINGIEYHITCTAAKRIITEIVGKNLGNKVQIYKLMATKRFQEFECCLHQMVLMAINPLDAKEHFTKKNDELIEYEEVEYDFLKTPQLAYEITENAQKLIFNNFLKA